MNERIDHAASALSLTGADWRNGDMAVAQLMEAQVHATLALVEQQRIANLIALSRPQEGMDGAELSLPSWIHKPSDDCGFDEIELRPDIAAALGLTAGQEGESRGAQS